MQRLGRLKQDEYRDAVAIISSNGFGSRELWNTWVDFAASLWDVIAERDPIYAKIDRVLQTTDFPWSLFTGLRVKKSIPPGAEPWNSLGPGGTPLRQGQTFNLPPVSGTPSGDALSSLHLSPVVSGGVSDDPASWRRVQALMARNFDPRGSLARLAQEMPFRYVQATQAMPSLPRLRRYYRDRRQQRQAEAEARQARRAQRDAAVQGEWLDLNFRRWLRLEEAIEGGHSHNGGQPEGRQEGKAAWGGASGEYRGADLVEMAQSRGDPKGIQIHLDDQDRDFIDQAVARGITPVSALRSRYTLLLHDKPGESGLVRFFGSGRRPFITVNIERTHLKHLENKLRSLGAVKVAEHGFRPLTAIGSADNAAYYNAAFGRQNASDILKSGKPIDINYGRAEVGATIRLKAVSGRPSQEPGGAVIVKPVPNDWSSSYLRSLFQDKQAVPRLQSLSDNKHDLAEVWRAVQTLVGDTRQAGKYILPEVWELFQKSQPAIGLAIYDGVIRQLRQFDPSALGDGLEVHQALMQTTAMILSNPLRGTRMARTDDFLRDVTNLFSDRDQLFKLAMSYTSQGHLRKVSGINTTNTRRREIGGMMAGKPFDLYNMGQEDRGFGNDTDIEGELRRMEPAMATIWAKLQRNGWDTAKLTDKEHDLFVQYEELDKELQRFKRTYRGRGQRGTGAGILARNPTIHPEQARIDQIEAELKRLGPALHPILDKLKMANWDANRLPDEEWDGYRRYEQLQKELTRLKAMPMVDADDFGVPAGYQEKWNRQSVGIRSEKAGGGGNGLTLTSFAEYVAAREALLLPKKPVTTGMSRINPFPATQQKLKRLFPTKAVSANASDHAKRISATSASPTLKPIPSPLRAAQDGFAGYF